MGRGANPKGGDANLLFGQIFPEKCMKMKAIGPTGGPRPWRPIDPPLILSLDLMDVNECLFADNNKFSIPI